MFDQHEPTIADLTAIETEWPLIDAELAVTDLECRLAARPYDVVAREQLAAANRQVTALAKAYMVPTTFPVSLDAARAAAARAASTRTTDANTPTAAAAVRTVA